MKSALSQKKTEDLSRKFFDVVPPAMHKVRMEMRAAMENEITVPQFRILMSISRGRNQVGEIARQHGVSLAAMSRMTDGLVERGLIERRPSPEDRRHIRLSFTRKGEGFFKRARKRAEAYLGEKIAQANPQDLHDLEVGLSAIEKIFINSIHS